MSGRFIVGIDPGVNTGWALLDTSTGKLAECSKTQIHLAWLRLADMHRDGSLRLVVFEDARLRQWFGTKGTEALQGAGSIKRDATAWAGYLAWLGCPYKAVKPAPGATKWKAEHFSRVTGWEGPSNEHGRDAACLIWGMRGIAEVVA